MARASRKIEIKEFARRVETLCDFFIAKYDREIGKDGSNDLKVLEDLKEDAADIHMDNAQIVSETLSGLSAYMKKGTL